MEQTDVFSRRIRWLALAVGLFSSASFFFLSPFAALGPLLMPLAVLFQPKLPDVGKGIVKWLSWIWALGWSQGLFVLSTVMLSDSPSNRYLIVLRTFVAMSVLLILWLDVELIADGVRRVQKWRSGPAQEQRPVGLGLWIFAAALNLWIIWGLISVIAIYRTIEGQIHPFVLSIEEATAVLVFDGYIVWRTLKARRTQSADVRA
jgi:hypothetical protein